MSDPEALEDLLLDLSGAGVDFVVVGGLAVIAHGYLRTTEDLDMVPRPEWGNWTLLAERLRALEARNVGIDAALLPNQPTRPEGLAERGSFELDTNLGRIDILQEAPWIPSFAELERDALIVPFAGRSIKVCSLGHLREMKRAAGRPQDLADLAALAASDE